MLLAHQNLTRQAQNRGVHHLAIHAESATSCGSFSGQDTVRPISLKRGGRECGTYRLQLCGVDAQLRKKTI
jgi:hypothetical protein